MKKVVFLMSGIALFGCGTSDKPSNSMRGSYELMSSSANDGKKDTVIRSSQLKIYTDAHYIYAGIGSDSTDFFGIGEYTVESDSVKESSIFTAVDSTTDNDPTTYRLAITKTDKGYKQVVNFMGAEVKYKLTEEYQKSGKPAESQLDGAWKCTRYYSLMKNDTVDHPITQYKAFADGNFVFAHVLADSTGKKFTGIGYGTFESIGDKQVRESIKVSTYKIAGMSFDVTVNMLDPTHYRQTVVENGVTNVEEYEKLAKR